MSKKGKLSNKQWKINEQKHDKELLYQDDDEEEEEMDQIEKMYPKSHKKKKHKFNKNNFETVLKEKNAKFKIRIGTFNVENLFARYKFIKNVDEKEINYKDLDGAHFLIKDIKVSDFEDVPSTKLKSLVINGEFEFH
jgi:hypothetical protein